MLAFGAASSNLVCNLRKDNHDNNNTPVFGLSEYTFQTLKN